MSSRRAEFLLLSAVMAAACAGNRVPGSKLDRPVLLRIEDPSALLADETDRIRAALVPVIERVAAELDLRDVTVTVRPDAKDTIAGYGFGGWTPDGRTVRLFIDPKYPDYAGLLSERLVPLLAHEMHHARRWRGPGYGSTLFEALISEGLADRFAAEFLGIAAGPWTNALSEDQATHFLALAASQADSRSSDHARWFFGSEPALPRWTGYPLGYRPVAKYQAAHPGVTASALVDEPADSFR